MDARRGIFADFLLATAVLTRLPVGLAVPDDEHVGHRLERRRPDLITNLLLAPIELDPEA